MSCKNLGRAFDHRDARIVMTMAKSTRAEAQVQRPQRKTHASTGRLVLQAILHDRTLVLQCMHASRGTGTTFGAGTYLARAHIKARAHAYMYTHAPGQAPYILPLYRVHRTRQSYTTVPGPTC